jgi:hypothetical protein
MLCRVRLGQKHISCGPYLDVLSGFAAKTFFEAFTLLEPNQIQFFYCINIVCINCVTYKFCYRINNVCINFVTYNIKNVRIKNVTVPYCILHVDCTQKSNHSTILLTAIRSDVKLPGSIAADSKIAFRTLN